MTKEEQLFFEKLYRKHYETLYQFLYRLIQDSDEAYDLTQDVFTLAFSKISELEKHPNPAGWLFTSARYCAMNYIRGRSRTQTIGEEEEQVPSAQTPEDLLMQKFFPEEALGKLLSEEEIRLLKDRFENGYSIEETAKRNQLTHAACKMRLSRIYRKLRSHPEIFSLLLWIMEVYR